MKMDFIANNKGLMFALCCLSLMPVFADYLLEEAHSQNTQLPSGYDERVFARSEPSDNWMDEACKPLNMLSSDLKHLHKEYGNIEGLRLFDAATLNQRQKFCLTKNLNELR